MSLLEGLRFSKGDSIIHKLDPRVKFLLTISFFIVSIMFFDLIPLMFIFLVQIPIILIGKIGK